VQLANKARNPSDFRQGLYSLKSKLSAKVYIFVFNDLRWENDSMCKVLHIRFLGKFRWLESYCTPLNCFR